MQQICVFCGSSPGADPAYLEAARRLGAALVERGLGLVYGGAGVGLMRALADEVLSRGGRVTGVMPEVLVDRDVAHTGLIDLRVVGSMHERKALMAKLSDGFIALPGGFGTLDEFCEVLSWGQLGLHGKPCGLLNVGGYFSHLIGFFDHALEQGFLSQHHRAMIIVSDDPRGLLTRFATRSSGSH